ncbi:MAG: biotin--[Oscillospiraceae bacterium]|nr:biotin--[acetyl-CoA-carboxylase] ligase [Oscillospiraceae bacterium]
MMTDAVLNDVLNEEGVRRYLHADGLRLQVVPVISSTNTVLKRMAEEGAEEGLCLIAEEQTAGKG